MEVVVDYLQTKTSVPEDLSAGMMEEEFVLEPAAHTTVEESGN